MLSIKNITLYSALIENTLSLQRTNPISIQVKHILNKNKHPVFTIDWEHTNSATLRVKFRSRPRT